MATCVHTSRRMQSIDGATRNAHPEELLLGSSPAIQLVREQLRNAAVIDAPVLLTGESGTGKELAAGILHQLSLRSKHNMVKVNCPAIPSQLFESELFGYEPGAFTGARIAKPGKFEMACQGTLFLDEIGELDIALQAKLLRTLQDFKVVRLGSVEERRIDVRLICGTNRDLEAEVQAGSFRSDLFYRINVLNIRMPSLRARAGDVPLLLNHFIRIYSDQFGQKAKPVSGSAMQILEKYSWPGNLRELENLAKRYVVLGGEGHVLNSLREPDDTRLLPLETSDINTPLRIQTKRAVQTLERRIILDVLRAHKWNRRSTARSLDISYRALLYKIKEAGLPSIRNSRTLAKPPQFENQERICP
jgi:two-component system, NtrC family, response regulator AtoC